MLSRFDFQCLPTTSCVYFDGRLIEGEVDDILTSYQKKQTHFLQELQGEFVCVLFDAQHQRIVAACDQMSVKSLYYTCNDDYVAFATSVESLRALPDIDDSLNQAYLLESFSRSLRFDNNYGENTLYQSIKRLPGAHLLTWDRGRVSVERYWYLEDKPIHFKCHKEYIEGFYEHLKRAVVCRVSPDEPLALEVSGGIDSLAIATVARQCFPKQTLLACSNVCPEKVGPNYPFLTSEKAYADAACQHLDITQMHVDQSFNLAARLDEYESTGPGFVEDLFSLMSVPFYQQAEKAGASVLLSGFGGDQIATQDAKYVIHEYWQQGRRMRALVEWWLMKGGYKSLQKIITKILGLYFRPAVLPKRYQNFIEWVTPLVKVHLEEYMVSSSAFVGKSGREIEANYVQGNMFGYLTSRPRFSNLYAKRHGVNVRFPMLDINLLNYCYNVPFEHKRRWGMGRRLVRKAIQPFVPNNLILRNDKTAAICPQQFIDFDQQLIAYFEHHPDIPQVAKKYIQWPKLQAAASKNRAFSPPVHQALFTILQLERLNKRFHFLET